MTWRPYQAGDWESFSGNYLLAHLIPQTRTMVDEAGVPWAVMGLVCYAPGTFEVFLDVRGGRASWASYRALHEEWNRIEAFEHVNTLIAFIDPETPNGEALAEVGGLEFRAFFPSWWNGEPRILMGREIR